MMLFRRYEGGREGGRKEGLYDVKLIHRPRSETSDDAVSEVGEGGREGGREKEDDHAYSGRDHFHSITQSLALPPSLPPSSSFSGCGVRSDPGPVLERPGVL